MENLKKYTPKITNLRLAGFADNSNDKSISIVQIADNKDETQLRFEFHTMYLDITNHFILNMNIIENESEILNEDMPFNVSLDSNDPSKKMGNGYYATGIFLTTKSVKLKQGNHVFTITLKNDAEEILDKSSVSFYVNHVNQS